MLYKGTDIDGLNAGLDGLEVRGTGLSQLIGHMSFPAATVRLIAGREPSAQDEAQANRFLGECLRQYLARSGGPASAVPGNGGLAVGVLSLAQVLVDAPEPLAYGLKGDLNQALCAAAVLPAMAVLAAQGVPDAGRRATPRAGDGDYVSALFHLVAGRAPETADERDVLEALLVAWHGGFGIVPPTLLAPRIVAGSGAGALEALAAGILAGGPNHIGASAGAMKLVATVCASVEAGQDLPAAAEAGIAAALETRGVIHGMGHPLLDLDPRPPRLRDIAGRLGPRLPLRAYDEIVDSLWRTRQLRPNIDMATAALLLSLGVGVPEVATAIALGARAFCMVAHIAERRGKPAFGVDRATARLGYQHMDIGWL